MPINPDWQSHIGKFTLRVAEVLGLKQKVKITLQQQGLQKIGEHFADNFCRLAKKYGKDKIEESAVFLSIMG